MFRTTRRKTLRKRWVERNDNEPERYEGIYFRKASDKPMNSSWFS